MNSKPIVIPGVKPFPVKYSLYMKIIDSIPEGKLSTLEAIDDFLSDLYNESFIERPLPILVPDFKIRYAVIFMAGGALFHQEG